MQKLDGTNRPHKGCLLQSELNQEGRAFPGLTSARNMYFEQLKFSTALHVSVYDCKNAMCVDFEVTNKFQLMGKFTNTESSNNVDQLYI